MFYTTQRHANYVHYMAGSLKFIKITRRRETEYVRTLLHFGMDRHNYSFFFFFFHKRFLFLSSNIIPDDTIKFLHRWLFPAIAKKYGWMVFSHQRNVFRYCLKHPLPNSNKNIRTLSWKCLTLCFFLYMRVIGIDF